jgi:3-carboxy-cis,cis-muconate cycloisomerase
MPHKQNPVLSVLVRSAALAAPSLGATLHLAAATTVDQRPDGAWHAEWPSLRALGRSCATAASLTAELLEGLQVHSERMQATATASAEGLLAERHALHALVDAAPAAGSTTSPETYLGATDLLIDAACDRADQYLETTS